MEGATLEKKRSKRGNEKKKRTGKDIEKCRTRYRKGQTDDLTVER